MEIPALHIFKVENMLYNGFTRPPVEICKRNCLSGNKPRNPTGRDGSPHCYPILTYIPAKFPRHCNTELISLISRRFLFFFFNCCSIIFLVRDQECRGKRRCSLYLQSCLRANNQISIVSFRFILSLSKNNCIFLCACTSKCIS